MDNLIYDCPIGHGQVPTEGAIDPRPGEPGAPATVYCPHCEMLVMPLAASSAAAESSGNIRTSDAESENRGRSRQGGTNAGGSQRGDLSDQRHAMAPGSLRN